MAVVVVRAPGGTKAEIAAADDMDTDDLGTLILTKGEARTEEIVALYAPGAWLSAEKR
jgi:hypothetical protein